MFVENIICLSSFGFPEDALDLRCIVSTYLTKVNRTVPQFKDNYPGKDWAASFIKRHTDVGMRVERNIKKARAEVSNEDIQSFFVNLTKELEGVPAKNIWNYDETNLSDDPGSKKAIVKRGTKYPERIMDTLKTSVSLICGSASGECLPP